METLTITDFLRARIAEDEANIEGDWAGGDGGLHILSAPMHERLLAECNAKRQILAAWDLTHHNINLAMLYIIVGVYSDHPDFNPGWA